MASELRVNTLKDASGNNSIATSYVASGSAKMWTSFTGITTTAIKDSFNSSSLTDVSSGTTNVSITTNMSDANWSGVKYSNANSGDTFSNDYHGGLTNRSSSIMKHTSHDQSAGTDGLYNDVHVMGDLA